MRYDKKLKTIEQILSEYKNKEYEYKINRYDKINIDGGSKQKSYIISPSMYKYFGNEIDVFDAGNKSSKYEYYINDSDSGNRWWFKEDWFVNKDILLEDSLFEI